MADNRQETRERGLEDVRQELFKRGWKVTSPQRGDKGVAFRLNSEDGKTSFPITVRTNKKKPRDTSLGLAPSSLSVPWWIIVNYAGTPEVTFHVYSLDEIRERMGRDPGTRSGKPESECAYWFDRRYYTEGSGKEISAARNGWDRLGDPKCAT